MKKLGLIFMFFTIVCSAQQDAQYTQYMYNTIAINPAYAGSRGVMSVFGLYRTQWIGLDGAPRTSTFSVNTPLDNSKLGLGATLVNDKIGPTNENTLSVDLSYSIETGAFSSLSFGLKGTANLFNVDINKLSYEDQNDEQFQDFRNKFAPNVGAGVYWHSDKAYLGLSIPNFIETKRYDDNDVAIFKDKINYYFMAGYVFDVNYYLKFKPALLTKMVEGAPLQVDLSGNFIINEKFTAGLAYRWSASVSAMAGFQVSERLYIGYGYDHETTRLRRFNSGSHEIFLRFEFFNNYNKMISPRFF
ncbi:type IX secretion system membrane protein PorP/SprF [Flavobacterium sp. 17A]|uniref:Type IX secretion system membrane protein PorP/SprF n=1 Tax=Flavobacterium potami TaxID=2872310 RepID=A0A9X1HCK5_9FLAO|nr:type IX secretion system membrane protein PorP/SprF [Flavobacterium potami]MBZ4036813.1 type IX secretion system membrane protein PorP/SprF [Flavobacterium potami]